MMWRGSLMFGLGLWVSALAGGCMPADTRMASSASPPRVELDRERLALAPLDFVRFCMSYASECRTEQPNAVIALTPEVAATLSRVTSEVNRRIRSTSEMGAWRIDPASGNCNDYVVTKRHELKALGLPASALLLGAARTPQGEGHLLLIVRTNAGDLVLDNLTSEILPIQRTPYIWLKRQSAVDARNWEVM